MLVLQAFKSDSLVPWKIRNRWDNCVSLTRHMIYKKGNRCADKLANIGLSINSLVWRNDLPNIVRADYTRNRLRLPCFRFVNF